MRQRTLSQFLRESLAFVVGHGDEHLSFRRLRNLVNRTNIRVIENRGGSGFLNEPRYGLFVDHALGKRFQGDNAIKGKVLSLIDDSHTSTADLLNYFEV